MASAHVDTRRLVWTVVSAVLLSGCTDSSVVKGLAVGMQRTLVSWRPLTNDYRGTCLRREEYRAADAPGQGTCATAAATQAKLDAVLSILDEYFEALGAVATGTNYSVSPGIDSLGQAAKNLTGDAAKSAAITGLAKVVAGLITSGVQRHAMSTMIDEIPNAERVVEVVRDVVVADYGGNLSDEARDIRRHVTFAAAQAGLGTVPQCVGGHLVWTASASAAATADQILLERYYSSQCNGLLVRRAAIGDFVRSADALLESLRQLQSSRARLKDREVVKALLLQGKELSGSVRAMDRAFAGT